MSQKRATFPYTKQHVSMLQESIFKQLRAVREDGQKEYAHQDDRPFRNFETLAEELDRPREEMLWVFLKKHLDGILAYIKGHKSQREDVRGRLKDAIMYLIILWAMIDEDQGVIPSLETFGDITLPSGAQLEGVKYDAGTNNFFLYFIGKDGYSMTVAVEGIEGKGFQARDMVNGKLEIS